MEIKYLLYRGPDPYLISYVADVLLPYTLNTTSYGLHTRNESQSGVSPLDVPRSRVEGQEFGQFRSFGIESHTSVRCLWLRMI
jgi:hypothetical protein